jgi:hypothetical protein
MIPLQHRTAAAVAAIDAAKTPAQKSDARRAGLAVHADLEKFLADENFKTAFKKAKPKNSIGMYKADPVEDHPVFLIAPDGMKITGPVTLPDGTKALPNPQYQIVCPASMVPAMLARGYRRFNDDAFTDRSSGMGNADPTRTNNT